MSPSTRKTYLIDGSSYIYRAFYAIPYLSTRDGTPTNAVYGFVNMLLKIIREEKPDRLVVIFDAKGPTFRKEIYPEYKANRKAMPEELVPQIPLIKEVVRAFNLPLLEKQGFEADDIIATLVKHFAADGEDITVVTGDKDFMQIVGEHVRLLDTMRDRVFGPAEVAERFGGGPEKVVEVMALSGDTSDNVPGVPGIGEKTAKSLIEEFGTLENLLANLDQVKGAKRRENLENFADQARLSHRLVTLVADVPVEIDEKNFDLKEPDQDALEGLFRKFEFHTLLSNVSAQKNDADYHAILTEEDFAALLKTLKNAGSFCLDTETTSLDPICAELVGLSFTTEEKKAWYIPVGHAYDGVPQQLDREKALQELKPILEDEKIAKIGQNLKYDALVLRRAGIQLRGIAFDTMIASYLTNPSSRSHGLDRLALEYLGHKMISYSEVTADGKKNKNFAQVDISSATGYAAEDADITLRLKHKLAEKVRQCGVEKLFSELEMALLPVLIEMEWSGVRIDSGLLHDFSQDLEKQIEQLGGEIHRLCGVKFNIGSPKQLGEVLFEKLQLPTGKKTKTGWSTDVEVLTKLAEKHEVCSKILDFRSMSKLKSTYTDALPQLVNPESGRIHTSFNQTVTVTGRLSSSGPNLQNIPVRTAEGRRIREAFIPADGCLLLSADYSQVELRILAHMAQEEALKSSFANGEDIHRRTAGEVLGLSPGEVSNEQRRDAKAINFGIIYGMSAFGLARELKIGRKEAQEYIDRYFARYPMVRAFMESRLEEAKKNKCLHTLLGRRCPLPEIESRNAAIRGNAERNAVNYPIQGSAADIIKVAMIRIDRKLKEEKRATRMLLQVHDELVFEVPEQELEDIRVLVKQEMENAVKLDVPLQVDIGVGKNWSEAH